MALGDNYLGKDIAKLGFGLMRLPKLEDGETIDIEQTKQMVDLFLAAGMTYFDTAYVYGQGASERAAREALVERHPRDSFTIATKLFAMSHMSEEEAKAELDISLERLGTDYVDFYLLHNLTRTTRAKYDEYDIWGFAQQKKAEGKIRHVGFSFHDGPELLRELITAHPEIEFVQLQVNYADWDDPVIASRANVEVCLELGMPYVVMEPVKGGSLANPPEPIARVLDEAGADVSYPTWAVRFAASQPGVITVLSGMSSLEQMEDNLSYMEHFEPLSESEMSVIERAQEAYASLDQIKCTNCEYCVPGCPMDIPIPQTFIAMNRYTAWNNFDGGKEKYEQETKDKGLASACIACGQCEGVCPQHLPIIELLGRVAEAFE